MSQSQRQTTLFSAEDWQVIYRTFSEVNFSAYDFDSIRAAMVDYIRINFPEDFNDWIESSEFVALIDLLAYLGQSLAFRIDLNARENFIDSAERRESVLRLARLISYHPKRNFASQGFLKIDRISTDEDIIDSNGINLANLTIQWNDSNNPDWFEQFILIMNSSFVSTNPFGRPTKSGTIGGIRTQLYQMQNAIIPRTVMPFTASIDGNGLPFELVNPDFIDGERFLERNPNPLEQYNLIYRNDGLGNASQNTGFFFYFKQGRLAYQDYRFDVPLENRVVNLDFDNINDVDVWVQEIDDNGAVISDWIKVQATVGSNVIFNSLNRNIRNIFSVITRDRDRVSVRFADGRFGDVPRGLFRFWYRQSAGENYEIRPQDIQSFQQIIPYFNSRGEPHNLTIEYSLKYAVRNATTRESLSDIRRRAPQNYYTQNRMVNGEDYNVFPLSTNRAIKIKATNRIYSGQSRYVDINDPTGQSQNTNIVGDDGIVYREFEENYSEELLPTSRSAGEIVDRNIIPLIKNFETYNFFNAYLLSTPSLYSQFIGSNSNLGVSNRNDFRWIRATNSAFSSTGVFGSDSVDHEIGQTTTIPQLRRLMMVGTKIRFRHSGWATIIRIDGNGTYGSLGRIRDDQRGPVILDGNVRDGDFVDIIIPPFKTTFNSNEIAIIRNEIENENSFGLSYNFTTSQWSVISSEYLNEDGQYEYVGQSGFGNNSSWLVKVIWTPSSWQFTSRGMQYVFESDEDVRFFYLNSYKSVDLNTNKEAFDNINILKSNSLPSTASCQTNGSYDRDIRFYLYDQYRYADGYIEPRRVKVRSVDLDNDGTVDNPLSYDQIVFPNRNQFAVNDNGSVNSDFSTCVPTIYDMSDWDYLVFWERYTDRDGYQYYRPLTKGSEILNFDDGQAGCSVADPLVPRYPHNQVFYDISNEIFYTYNAIKVVTSDCDRFEEAQNGAFLVRIGRGLNYDEINDTSDGMLFKWQHFAPNNQRIDPAVTNIIDMYVMTRNYYQSVLQWVINESDSEPPSPPTPEELRITFSDLNEFKMVSDEIVYHPVKFKFLFGPQSPEELRVIFKVVKLDGVEISDSEIRSRVISAINEYFDIVNWDFGETFYFTELAAYIHQRMATILASIVIVPLNEEANFGNLFQIKSEPNEVFMSTARVTDVQIVSGYTQNNLRIS